MGFNLKKNFAVDSTLVVEGVWRDMPGGTGRVLVARMGNQRFKDAYRKVAKQPKFGRTRIANMTDRQEDELLMDICSKTILLGWEGLSDGEETMAYSPERAYQAFTEYSDFFDGILEMSSEIEAYRSAEVAATEGNS